MVSSPEGKKVAWRRLTTRPRGSKWISILPWRISVSSALLKYCIDGSSSAAAARWLGLGPWLWLWLGLSSCDPPGPFIWALPLPFSSTVPPRTSRTAAATPPLSRASLTESETCWARALSVWDEANITTKKANIKVMKSAYETSHRSLLSCSGCRCLRATSTFRGNWAAGSLQLGPGFALLAGGRLLPLISFELGSDQFRIQTLHNEIGRA